MCHWMMAVSAKGGRRVVSLAIHVNQPQRMGQLNANESTDNLSTPKKFP